MDTTKLQIDIFKSICHQIEYPNNEWNFIKHVFDSIRQITNGMTNLSYNGRGYSRDLNRIILNCLLDKHYDFDRIECHYTTRRIHFPPAYSHESYMYSDEWHTFLKCYKDEQEIIIDPSYKSLLMIHRGSNAKYTSPYANRVFELPAIFVGSFTELTQLNANLAKYRKDDPLHSDDDIHEYHTRSRIEWTFTHNRNLYLI